MTFMRKFLDILNMNNWEVTNVDMPESMETDKYAEYYNRMKQEKSNNLNISYYDVEKYDMKPFDLNKKFITDGNFTAIELEGRNLDVAYQVLQFVNKMLIPYQKYYLRPLPSKITTDYLFGRKLPHSHLRLNPYTYSHEDNAYPLLLWIAYSGHHGNEYLYRIYFDNNGEIGNCDLQFYNYTIQIRKKDGILYVRKISETLTQPPYGTRTLYIRDHEYKKKDNPPQKKNMGQSDLESFMVECNAKIAHEEEMAQYQDNGQTQKEV